MSKVVEKKNKLIEEVSKLLIPPIPMLESNTFCERSTATESKFLCIILLVETKLNSLLLTNMSKPQVVHLLVG